MGQDGARKRAHHPFRERPTNRSGIKPLGVRQHGTSPLTNRPRQFRPGHVRPRAEANRDYDRHRGSARERGYTSAWDRAAKAHLQRHPLCVYCQLVDVVRAAECVDHLYPQRQFPDTFWRSEWWCSSCKECHDGFKQSVERKGRAALDALASRLGLPLLG